MGIDNEKILDFGFSVFNGHINNADKKTRKFMKLFFPNRLKKLEKLEKKYNGIMGIFKEKSNSATKTYSMLISAFVNEKELV